MKGLRRARAAEQIRRDLADLLESEVDDPSIPLIRITAVELAPDYSYAKVLVVPADLEEDQNPDNEERFLGPLRRVSGYLRSLLADRLDMRRVPKLDFKLDRGARNATRVEQLLDRLAKRRKEDPLSAILLVLALSLFSAPSAPAAEKIELERYEASASVMGSEMRIALYGPHRGALASAAVAAFDEARRIDRLISNYRDDSEWSRINDRAADEPVRISPESVELLEKCLDYSRRSEGAFDVTVGSLVEAWGFFRGSGELPGGFRLRRALAATGYRHVQLDPSANTVRFDVSGLALDPGGIGKGYAVEKVGSLLRGYGIDAALISAGTSTLYAIGAPPDQPDGWPVEIRDPVDANKTAAVVRSARSLRCRLQARTRSSSRSMGRSTATSSILAPVNRLGARWRCRLSPIRPSTAKPGRRRSLSTASSGLKPRRRPSSGSFFATTRATATGWVAREHSKKKDDPRGGRLRIRSRVLRD